MAGGGHREALEDLGTPAAALAALVAYLELVERWDRRVDLTAAHEARGRAEVLVRAPLAVAGLVEGPTLVDVGSGNGSPGLVLALLRPELRVTLLEPRQKRWAFLREACRALDRRDVSVLRERHDTYAGPPAQTVTLRGLRLPLGELAGCVAPAGRLIVIGGPAPAAEPFVPEALPAGSTAQLFRRRST